MNPYLDPNLHLQLMQEAGIRSIPGLGMPMGNAGGLMQMASMYASPIAGNPSPNMAPLSPLGLESYGLPGMMASLTGNALISASLTNQGLVPMGSAGSYTQALQAHQLQAMQRNVSAAVANQDADSFYRSMRGVAALTGNPFDQSQRIAARKLAASIAAAGPTLGAFAPQFLDAMAGDTGSVQAMAAQMMEANRYRIDPRTGRIGFSEASNTQFINEIYENLFSRDNLAQMQGLRAGETGQLYRELAADGLLGTRGSLRSRTIDVLANNLNTLPGLLNSPEIASLSATDKQILQQGDNLNGLSTEALTTLRQLTPLKEQFSKQESGDVSNKLKEYVGAIAAIKDVFGENGNPNAPMPVLVNALKAITSGNMQRFDAAQLNTIVRDMQAMSQVSGKSIDQLTFMMQSANQSNTAVLGGLGGAFNPITTNVAVAAGMRQADGGGMVGFGALNREQTEQAAMSLMSRSLGSTMMNSLGVMLRLEKAGGFANNAAGQRMQAIMHAIRTGKETYEFQGKTYEIPRQEAEFRNLIGQGAVDNVDISGFGMMLQDNVANQRALFENPEAQQAAYIASRQETLEKISLGAAGRLSNSNALDGVQNKKQTALALSRAATLALNSMADVTDTDKRNAVMAEAIRQEAAKIGINISEQESKVMATSMYGVADQVARARGLESYEGLHQFIGKDNLEGMLLKQSTVTAQSGVNQALSNLGPRGGMMQRFFSALQNQGNRGSEANLSTLVADMFSADSRLKATSLIKPMQEIVARKADIDNLMGRLASATPEERVRLTQEISAKTKELEAIVNTTQKQAIDAGLNAPTVAGLSAADLDTRRAALRDRGIQVNSLIGQNEVTDTEIAAHENSVVGKNDLLSLAKVERDRLLKQADAAAAGDISNLSKLDAAFYDDARIRFGETEAREKLRARLRKNVGSADKIAASEEFKEKYLSTGYGSLSAEDKKAVAAGRRQNLDFRPDEAKVVERQQKVLNQLGLGKTKTEDELKNLTPEELQDYEKNQRLALLAAERQLMAENQLQAMGLIGKDQNLVDSHEAIGKALGLELSNLNAEERTAAVESHIDKRILEQFGTTPGANQGRLKSLLDATAKVQGLKIGTDSSTNLEKLDLLLDEYAGAKTSEDKEKIAKKYNMTSAELDKLQADTEFTKLSEDKEGVTIKDMLDRIQEIETTKEEEKQKQMSITGTLEIVGDIVGHGTVGNATGVW